MITQLSVSNFKSWQRINQMRFAPITGLFGTNSSGKTSVLQLLLMIKQTVESTDRLQVLDFGNEKSPANLGSFRETVFSHTTPGSMEWSLTWKLTKPLVIKAPENKEHVLFQGDEVGFRVAITETEKKRLQVNKLTYSFGGREFIMERKLIGKNNYELSVSPSDGFRFIRAPGRVWDLPAPVKCYGFPNEVNARYQRCWFLVRPATGV